MIKDDQRTGAAPEGPTGDDLHVTRRHDFPGGPAASSHPTLDREQVPSGQRGDDTPRPSSEAEPQPPTPGTQALYGSRAVTAEHGVSGPFLQVARVTWLALLLLTTALWLWLVGDAAVSPSPSAELVADLAGGGGILQPLDSVLRSRWAEVFHFSVIQVFGLVISLRLGVRRFRDGPSLAMASLINTGMAVTVIVLVLDSAHLATWSPWRVAAAGCLALGQVVCVIGTLIFPDGRFVPRWTRLLAPVVIGMLMSYTAAWLVLRRFSWPAMGLVMAGVGMTTLAAAMRYRRSRSLRQRAQLRWLGTASGSFVVMQLLGVGLYDVISPILPPAASSLVLLAAYVVLAASYMIPALFLTLSISKGGWHGVDRVLYFVAVYGSIAMVLGGIAALVFFIVQLGLAQFLDQGNQGWAMLAASALVAATFRPAQARIRRFVDRRLFKIHIDFREMGLSPRHSNSPTTGSPSSHDSIGPYTGLELLGRGGMGVVYRAFDPALDRQVAIKRLTGDPGDEEAVRRFQREAWLGAQLEHPNIAVVYDVGHDGEWPYIVMEYIHGRDLNTHLKQRGRLDLDEAVAILRDVAGALDHAHQVGVVHRDVKPGNIMLQFDGPTGELGRAVLMDMGIALLVDGATRLTQPQALIGSLGYLSPEQIEGCEDIDGRSDVYALGVVAYRMITGQPPFRRDSEIGLVLAHLHHPPDDPRMHVAGLSAQVSNVLLRALHKSPEMRYAKAGSFFVALEQAVASLDIDEAR